MDTLYKFFEIRKGIVLCGNITEQQIYESYHRFAMKRDGFALSADAVRPKIHSEIWGIRLWWAAISPHMAQQVWN